MPRLRQRLARVEGAVPPAPLSPEPCPPANDAPVLAAALARAFGALVDSYRQHFGLSPEEARQRAAEAPEEYRRRILDGPADQVGWCELDTLAREDPALALQRWEQVKEAAREEVRGGHRAAGALQGLVDGYDGTCWSRAQFLGLRAELVAAWRPRDGMELQLIDQLAQWQTLLWGWQSTLTAYTMLFSTGARRRTSEESYCDPPRLSDAEAAEQAAEKVERCHRMYLRTLRALQDQRRLGPPVIVRRAGQVNIGQQQVNVSG